MKRSVSGRADIKQGMARLPRYLFPLTALIGLPLACSSEDPVTQPPPPPVGGTNPGTGGSTGGSGVLPGGTTGTGGSSGASSMSGSGAGGGATVPPGGACTSTAQCQGTGFKCNATTKVCDCSVDKPDICGEGAAAVCSQKMTDPKNCGTCGMACAAGAACDAGACSPAPTELLAKGAGCGVIQLAIQGANIYWTESMTGKVRMMPIAGGTPMDIATGQTEAGSIVADATSVYWVVPGDGATVGSGKVMKLPLAGTGTPTVVKAAATAKEIFDVAVAAGKVYYTLGNDVHQVAPDGTGDIIVGTAVNYDAPAKVEGDPHGVAVSATMVAWTDVGDRNGVESDDLLEETNMPLTDKTGYHELAQSVGSLRNQIEADATYAYWIDGARFVRNLLAAAMPVPDAPIVEAASDIKGFAITATTVYLSTKDGSIVKHAIAPGASSVPTPIAIDQTQSEDDHAAGSVVVDATKVYWATSDCAIRATGL